MKTKGTGVIRHGLLTKYQVRTKITLCLEFPVFMHQVIVRRLQRIVGMDDDPFLLNVSTAILVGYRKRFLNTAYGRYARKVRP